MLPPSVSDNKETSECSHKSSDGGLNTVLHAPDTSLTCDMDVIHSVKERVESDTTTIFSIMLYELK